MSPLPHTGQSCANCYYFSNGASQAGRCQVSEPGPSGSWPTVQPTDWCGDWSADGTPKWKGEPGKDGADGQNGKDGRDGIDGKDGADGPAGPKGDPGEPGPPGVLGLQSARLTPDENGAVVWQFNPAFEAIPSPGCVVENPDGEAYSVTIISLTAEGMTLHVVGPNVTACTLHLSAFPAP